MRTKILITALAIIVLTGFGIAQLAHPTLNVQGAETPAATLAATMSATESAAALRFDGNEAMKHAAAQVNFGFRPTGSAESIKAGDHIIAALKSYGWTVTEQPITLDINGQTVKGRNIIGSQGSGPVIIFGAHYDTRLWADHDPDPANQRKPVMGADDGASGVAIMLELARVLNRRYTYDNEIRLVFLDAEDNGNIPGWKDFSLGTYQYVDKLDKRPEYVVILDMLGDKDLNVYYEGASMRSAPQIMEGIWNVAEKL